MRCERYERCERSGTRGARESHLRGVAMCVRVHPRTLAWYTQVVCTICDLCDPRPGFSSCRSSREMSGEEGGPTRRVTRWRCSSIQQHHIASIASRPHHDVYPSPNHNLTRLDVSPLGSLAWFARFAHLPPTYLPTTSNERTNGRPNDPPTLQGERERADPPHLHGAQATQVSDRAARPAQLRHAPRHHQRLHEAARGRARDRSGAAVQDRDGQALVAAHVPAHDPPRARARRRDVGRLDRRADRHVPRRRDVGEPHLSHLRPLRHVRREGLLLVGRRGGDGRRRAHGGQRARQPERDPRARALGAVRVAPRAVGR